MNIELEQSTRTENINELKKSAEKWIDSLKYHRAGLYPDGVVVAEHIAELQKIINALHVINPADADKQRADLEQAMKPKSASSRTKM